ncbi:hypothetical protein CF394_10445 [Tetzosporium hominis]|uniref:Uncharacterized protein n=1 Tax=Tetzosporium hominis TaxID=2020506 RepID=A0A264W229_9BACL|nr:hypothetical protein CF394_10445 [Tetzosporium hominis]
MISGIDLILQETAPRSTARFFATFFAAVNMREGEGKDTRSVVSEWFEEPAAEAKAQALVCREDSDGRSHR